jgi:hypothetical protein
MAESPVSPLSSHSSSEFTEDVKLEECEGSIDNLHENSDTYNIPPAKRQKIGHSSYRSTPQPHHEIDDDVDISSDTSRDVPKSPQAYSTNFAQDDDIAEQVTVCRWRDCDAGDLGNMDNLVNHLHDEHIGVRTKQYACEWEGCPRIDTNHASGYALRAHMRSHTREKPFYCALPGQSPFITASRFQPLTFFFSVRV